MLESVMGTLFGGVIIYLLIVNLLYTFVLFMAILEMWKRTSKRSDSMLDEVFQSRLAPMISLLVPSHNEEATIIDSVHAMLLLRYPRFDVVVINDGSKDATLDRLKEEFQLKQVDRVYRESLASKPVRGYYISLRYKNLIVIDKQNGGKADSLNCGINAARGKFVCAVDSDVILERDSLLQLILPLMDDPDHLVASGGVIRSANGCKVGNGRITQALLPMNPLVSIQTVEYLRAFFSGRLGLMATNALLIISGAFGIFNKEVVKEVGGYDASTIGEDMELVVRMHRRLKEAGKPYRITFSAEAVCWTEVPDSLRILGRQRNRWQRGLLDSLMKHKKMMLNPRYGAVGMFGVPFFWICEMCSPVVELLGYILTILSLSLGRADLQQIALFFLVSVVYGILLSLMAILIEEFTFHRYDRWQDFLKLVASSLLENIGYRQLSLYWRLRGIWDYFRGAQGWGEMTRQGFRRS